MIDKPVQEWVNDHPKVYNLQIDRYRQMSSEQRLGTGLRMWEFARELVTASIQNESPHLNRSQVSEKVIRRMQK